jgi:Na+/glutamate symporter
MKMKMTIFHEVVKRMNPAQLALFVTVLVIWVIITLSIYPWLQGRAVRRDLRIIGYIVLFLLLAMSLITAPELNLWLQYMGIALGILVLLLLYNHWVMRRRDGS